jgi:hypothetical protein
VGFQGPTCTAAQTASKSDMPPSTHSLVAGRLRLPCSMHLDFFPQPFGPAHFFVASACVSVSWPHGKMSFSGNLMLHAVNRPRLPLGLCKTPPHRAILLWCSPCSAFHQLGRESTVAAVNVSRRAEFRDPSSTSLVSSTVCECPRRLLCRHTYCHHDNPSM